MTTMTDIKGLTIIPNYITGDEEKELIDKLNEQEWDYSIKRATQHYGYYYNYNSSQLSKWHPKTHDRVPPVPSWISKFTQKMKDGSLIMEFPNQIIVNRYLSGEGISPHTDRTIFKNKIYSLSLGSGCVVNFNNIRTGDKKAIYVKPRTLLIMKDDARYRYTHGIDKIKMDRAVDADSNTVLINRGTRYSITFRNVH